VAEALRACRSAFWSVALFSGVVNLLMLAGPLYMLQIYDRVLASRSVSTLVGLSVFLLGAYAFQGILTRSAPRLWCAPRASWTSNWSRASTAPSSTALLRAARRNAHPVRDLDQIRAFLTSTGPIAIVDLPWMPFFLASASSFIRGSESPRWPARSSFSSWR
jgi:ATP-binding cassette subfamily C protein